MEIKLYKSQKKALKLFLLSSLFVLPSAWFIFVKGDNNFAFWLSLCFFGLGYIVSLFNLLDRRVQIILNINGIWDRTLKQDVIKWEQIMEVYEWEYQNQKFIPLVISPDFIFKKKPNKIATFLNKKLNAQELNLNISQIKVNSEKLITLINILKDEKTDQRENTLKLYKTKL